jgi:hypothetical protein
MAHCKQQSSTEIAALFDKMSEDDGDASYSDSGEADDDATLTDEADPRRQFDLEFADYDATLSDEADPRRQLDLEFESVDGSDGPGRRAGRPIEHKDDPKKREVNRRARERYKRRKVGAVRIIKPSSAQRQLKRNEQKGALEARDAFAGGDMDEGCRLQALVLNTPAGRKMFPSMAERLGELSAQRAAGEAVCNVLRAGSFDASQKQAVIRLCTASMNPAEQTDFCEAANINKKTMKASHWPSRSTSSPSSNPFSWKPNSRTTKTPDAIPGIEKVVVDFFCEHAPVRSGAKTETREMGLSITNLRVKFYEEYPRLLRLLNNHSPLLLQAASTKLSKGGNLSRFQSSLMAAVQQKLEPEFDEDKDETQRRDLAVRLVKIQLERKRLGSNSAHTQFIQFEKDRQANLESEHAEETASIIQLTVDYDIAIDKEHTAEDADDEDDLADPNDSTKHVMYPPPSDRVFFRILKKYKIHWTSNIKKVECPIHDEGPLLSLERAKLVTKQSDVVGKLSVTRKALQEDKLSEILKASEAQLQLELRGLEALLRKLRDKEVLYSNHLKQYEACRRTIKKVEAGLGPGEAVMYRDFVAAYNCEGTKLQNLVLVVLWRETIGAPLHVWKFSNLCDDPNSRSADAYYVADVFEFYFDIQQNCLQHSCPFFRQLGIKKIYVSGDHGPHFSSIATMYNESTMKEKYDLEVVIFFLCSYHCFNRCDQAGVEPKKLAKEHGKGRESVRSSAEVASVLNASRYHNSHATDFPRINRNEDRFPTLAKDDSLNLRKMCQVQYSFLDQHGQQASEAGVILCRLTPAAPGESGELFEVYDLLADPIGGPLCRACSKFMQRPVRHGETQCPHLHTKTDVYSESVKIDLRKSFPDPDRIQGPQHNKAWKKAGNQPQGKFPCRVEDSRGARCMSGHHYNTAHNANRHMAKVHSLEAGSLQLYPTTFVCTVAGCTKKFASEEKREDHVAGHTTKPKTATKRKTTTAAVSTVPAAAGTHASVLEIARSNDENGGAHDDDAEVQTTTEVATAPAGTKLSFLDQRQANIARNQAAAESLGLPALAVQVAAPRKRRTFSSDSSDSAYSPSQEAAPKKYNLRRRRVLSFPVSASASDESSAEEAEEEKAKDVPMEKTIDFCVVFGENEKGDAEVWFAVETEGEEDELEDGEREDGERSLRWLEQDEDEVWRTIEATNFVSAEYVFTTKRVTLRHSAGEVYELKSEDVPTEQEHANYDEALKKKFAAPATVPARPSTARPSTPRTGESFSDKKWKDVAEWQQAPENGLYHFTLKATECREGYYFLMSCTATPEPTAGESAAENQRSFLLVGKVKTVNSTVPKTFTYTLFSAASPANAYDSSCVDGGWICQTHAAQKEPANHSDVFMYFRELTKTHRLPAAAKDRARTLCAFLN